MVSSFRLINALFALSLVFSCLLSQDVEYSVVYRCPPCGCEHDDHVFEKAGHCPSCEMALRATVSGLEAKPRIPTRRYTAAVLLFDMADIMDVTGPMSVFEHAGFSVLTVAKDKNPKRIGQFVEIKPDCNFQTLPKVDVLVIPGGGPAEVNQDSVIVNWI